MTLTGARKGETSKIVQNGAKFVKFAKNCSNLFKIGQNLEFCLSCASHWRRGFWLTGVSKLRAILKNFGSFTFSRPGNVYINFSQFWASEWLSRASRRQWNAQLGQNPRFWGQDSIYQIWAILSKFQILSIWTKFEQFWLNLNIFE